MIVADGKIGAPVYETEQFQALIQAVRSTPASVGNVAWVQAFRRTFALLSELAVDEVEPMYSRFVADVEAKAA